MSKVFFFAVVFVLLAGISCTKREASSPEIKDEKRHKVERIHVIIDEKLIATTVALPIITPVLQSGNIYSSYEDYEGSLSNFSYGQRLMFAVYWYIAEVNNGGHYQFYSNSTGLVWNDALDGFREIGMPEVAAIIAESARRMGGRPPFDRGRRNHILEERKPNFDDLDNRFYNLNGDIDVKMLSYIRTRPKEFLFEGEIERKAQQ